MIIKPPTTLHDSSNSVSLQAYLESVFSGDPASEQEVYNDWYKKLFPYFMRRLRNHEASLDCISDTFTKMYKSEAQIEQDSVFDKYLYRVAQTVLLDYVRKHKTKVLSLDDEELGVIPENVSPYDAEAKAKRNLMRKQIDNCLDTLSSREGEMIRLRVFEEKEYEEICEIMNLSIDATRKAYSRALKKFETVYLDRYGNYE